MAWDALIAALVLIFAVTALVVPRRRVNLAADAAGVIHRGYRSDVTVP